MRSVRSVLSAGFLCVVGCAWVVTLSGCDNAAPSGPSTASPGAKADEEARNQATADAYAKAKTEKPK